MFNAAVVRNDQGFVSCSLHFNFVEDRVYEVFGLKPILSEETLLIFVRLFTIKVTYDLLVLR